MANFHENAEHGEKVQCWLRLNQSKFCNAKALKLHKFLFATKNIFPQPRINMWEVLKGISIYAIKPQNRIYWEPRICLSQMGHFTNSALSAYNSKTAEDNVNLSPMLRVAKKISYPLEKFANP